MKPASRHADQLRTVEHLGALPSKLRLALFRHLVIAWPRRVELKPQQTQPQVGIVHRHVRMKPGGFGAGLVVRAQSAALCTRGEVRSVPP